MITIKIKGIADIAKLIGPAGEKNIHLPPGSEIRDLIDTLTYDCDSQLTERILSKENDVLNEKLRFLLNGQDLEFLDGLSTKLKDGDRFSIIPLLAGG